MTRRNMRRLIDKMARKHPGASPTQLAELAHKEIDRRKR